MSRLEDNLRAALVAGTAPIEPAPDLFARVEESLARQQVREHWRRRLVAVVVIVAAIASTAIVLAIDFREGEVIMDWWIYEVIMFVAMAVIALLLGPFIKRFGRNYAAEVFRSNPTTGKSFIVLTDFAYYLIFSAYILFTTRAERLEGWGDTVGVEQVQFSIGRVGGILLILGLLHSANLLVLPIIGRLLTLNRRLDQQMRDLGERDLSDRDMDQV